MILSARRKLRKRLATSRSCRNSFWKRPKEGRERGRGGEGARGRGRGTGGEGERERGRGWGNTVQMCKLKSSGKGYNLENIKLAQLHTSGECVPCNGVSDGCEDPVQLSQRSPAVIQSPRNSGGKREQEEGRGGGEGERGDITIVFVLV